ncbi:MAG: permease [Myxococcota bacterium]
MDFAHAAWNITVQLAPWLLLGAAASGVLHVLLPHGFVHRNFRGRGGVTRAVLVGIPLPLCSCGVIPAGIGLKRDGASDGAAVGFLIATPQTGVDSVLVSASMLGWPFALFKVGAALTLGLVGGYATDGLTPAHAATSASPANEHARTWREGWDHAVELIRTVWLWLVIGVLLSAAITVLFPAEALSGIGAGTLVAMLAALMVSLPLYVCATASVPIAAALVSAGFPPGAALVFLMAGPATNLTTIGAVSRAFGLRALAIYLTTIVVGSMGLGYAFDSLLPVNSQALAHVHGASVLEGISAVLLCALVLAFAISDLRSRFPGATPGDDSRPKLETRVDGLTCNGCVRKLEAALRAGSATDVRVDREAGLASARGLDEGTFHALIRKAGFTPL